MSELVEMTHEEWREWFKSTVGRYPTILDTHQMKLETGDPDIHAFQGIVTKLRTTKGSPYALDVMAEAADEIERLHEKITELENSWNMLHFSCDNPDHGVAYHKMAWALGYTEYKVSE